MRHFYYFILTLLFLLTACTPSHTLTLTRQSEAVSWTPKLNNEPLQQTLIVPKEGLSEIELLLALPSSEGRAASAPDLVSRPLHWEIVENRSAVLRDGVLETAGYLHNTPLRLQFERLSGPRKIKLFLKGPRNANMKLWRSRADHYTDGQLLHNRSERDVDLTFTLRVEERPIDLFGALKVTAERWQDVGRWRPSLPPTLDRMLSYLLYSIFDRVSMWIPSSLMEYMPNDFQNIPIRFMYRVAHWFKLLWIPLLLIAPGWLLGWFFGGSDSPPIAPAAAGLSLALMPFLYLWSTVIGLSLYETLIRNLFYISSTLLLLLMLHYPQRRRAMWPSSWHRALSVLGLFILAGIATWLLAGRFLFAPPGQLSFDAGLLAQDMLTYGSIRNLESAFPPAALTFTLTLMSRQAVPFMLLLSALILGVATIPSVYALAAEIITRTDPLGVSASRRLPVPQPQAGMSVQEAGMTTQQANNHFQQPLPSPHSGRRAEAWFALWLVPFAWLWPAAWEALANGDLLVLYNLVLLPITVALGLRALRATTQVWRALLLAAFPLAALILVQGGAAIGAWGVTLLLRAYKEAQTADNRKYDLQVERSMSKALRALWWLILAGILWLPAGFKGASLMPQLSLNMMGYDWLLLMILFALRSEGKISSPF